MKLTKTKLREIIREEIKSLREISGTGSANTKTKQADVVSKKSTRNTKQTAKSTKQTNLDTKTSYYNTKAAVVDSSKQYRRKSEGKGKYVYSDVKGKGYSTNTDYTSQVSDRYSALTAKNTAQSEFDTASTDLDTAISNLSAAERAQVQAYIDANMGYGGMGKGKSGNKNSKKDNK